jgi:hypothetical protein
VFENRVLRRIFGPEREQVTARTEVRGMHTKILIVKLEGKRSLGRYRRR